MNLLKDLKEVYERKLWERPEFIKPHVQTILEEYKCLFNSESIYENIMSKHPKLIGYERIATIKREVAKILSADPLSSSEKLQYVYNFVSSTLHWNEIIGVVICGNLLANPNISIETAISILHFFIGADYPNEEGYVKNLVYSFAVNPVLLLWVLENPQFWIHFYNRLGPIKFSRFFYYAYQMEEGKSLIGKRIADHTYTKDFYAITGILGNKRVFTGVQGIYHVLEYENCFFRLYTNQNGGGEFERYVQNSRISYAWFPTPELVEKFIEDKEGREGKVSKLTITEGYKSYTEEDDIFKNAHRFPDPVLTTKNIGRLKK